MANVSGKYANKAFQTRYFYWFTALLVAVAVLEFGQDYISSLVNGNSFQVFESLSYKLFWLFFAPFSIFLWYVLSKAINHISGFRYVVFNFTMVLVLTTVHLLAFSIILFGISNIASENPMTLPYLIYEKLSTRLYIALSMYLFLSAGYFLFMRRRSQQEANQRESTEAQTITVKNGRSTIIIDVDEIMWIGSDGAYLEIYTNEKKHVTLDSLKNIIETLPKNFKRIHRSTIINIDYIKELKSRGNGDYDVITKDQQKLRLSRNYAKPLKGVLL